MEATTPSVYSEDLRVGETYHLGQRSLSEEEIISFGQDWDPLYFHVDSDAAKSSFFGTIIASGVQTIAIFQRMCVDKHFGTWSLEAGRGFKDVRFVRAVTAGMTLRGQFVVANVRNRSAGNALVVLDGSLSDSDGNHVLTIKMEILMGRNPKT